MPRKGDIYTIRAGDGTIHRVIVDGGERVGGMGIVSGVHELERPGGPLRAMKTLNMAEVERYAQDCRISPDRALEIFRLGQQREAQVLLRIRNKHPDPHTVNVVTILYDGEILEPVEERGNPAFVMEYCQHSLETVLNTGIPADPGSELDEARRRLKTPEGIFALLRGKAMALKALADLPKGDAGDDTLSGTYRDDKPSNTLLQGRRYLQADFSTYKEQSGGTRSMSALTRSYAAPEIRREHQRRGRDGRKPGFVRARIDYAAGDVFAAALQVFECLTGERVQFQHLHTDPEADTEHGTVLTAEELRALAEAANRLGTGDDRDGRLTRVVGAVATDWSRMRRELPALIAACLSRTPQDRPKVDEILRTIEEWRATRAEPPSASPDPADPAPDTAWDRTVTAVLAVQRRGSTGLPGGRRPWRLAALALAPVLAVMLGSAMPIRVPSTPVPAPAPASRPATPQIVPPAPDRVSDAVPISFVPPAPGAPATPGRWSGGLTDRVERLCPRPGGGLAVPVGQRLVFVARIGEAGHPGSVHPSAVLVGEDGARRTYAPGSPWCGPAPAAGGETWGCAIPVPVAGVLTLTVTATRQGGAPGLDTAATAIPVSIQAGGIARAKVEAVPPSSTCR